MQIKDFEPELESLCSREDGSYKVQVGFINSDGKEDETEFDVQPAYGYVIEELEECFREFSKENGINEDSVIYITWNREPIVELGKVIITVGVAEKTFEDNDFFSFITESLAEFKIGHWGNLSNDDKASNDNALIEGCRLLASYKYLKDNTNIWIISEADRSATTVLFPDEY